MTTAAEIWEAHKNSPAFQDQLANPKLAAVMEDYVLNRLLPALGDLVDQPATPINVIKTMRAFIQDVLQTDLIERMIQAGMTLPMPVEYLDELVGGYRQACLDLLRDTEPMSENEDWYRDDGLTDDDMYERMGMSPANRSAAGQGQLTIGQLLTSQTEIVLVLGLSEDDEDGCSCGGCGCSDDGQGDGCNGCPDDDVDDILDDGEDEDDEDTDD